MTGFESLEASNKQFLRHDAQFNADPRTSAQFITDCNWYQADAPALGRFKMAFKNEKEWRGGFNQLNEPGVLQLDVRSLWPPHQEIMLAQPPENLGGQQWVHYEVSVDGKTLAEGDSGVWILGAMNVDVPVAGAKELTLKITTSSSQAKTLFLAHARLLSADGEEIPVTVAADEMNIEQPPVSGKGYYGGPITIAGEPCATAIPAQPENSKAPGVIRISLTGKDAVRFKATLGGNYPFGHESQGRRVYALHSRGTEASFLTVIEPYENQPVIKSAEALSADKLRVKLADGRVQEISIQNFEGSGKDIQVSVAEIHDGKQLRPETTTR